MRKKVAQDKKKETEEVDPLGKKSLEAEVEAAFAKYDTDKNGTLDVEEATKFL